MGKVTQSTVAVLVRAYQSGKLKMPASAAARYFADECGFGTVIGSNWHLDAKERQAIRAYLVAHHGIENPETVDFNFAGKTRIEAAAVSPEEKFAGRGPHAGYVLARAPSGTAKFNSVSLAMLGKSCVYVDARDVTSIGHDCIIVVENFEAVTQFEGLPLMDFPYRDPLLLFRGDATFPANGALTLARSATVPVLAWADFDPQGLNIAAAVPQVQGAIFPVEFTTLSREDLYDKQRALVKPVSSYPPAWASPITAMFDAKRGLTQERMIALKVSCRLYQR